MQYRKLQLLINLIKLNILNYITSKSIENLKSKVKISGNPIITYKLSIY